jgi:hypothetical protein
MPLISTFFPLFLLFYDILFIQCLAKKEGSQVIVLNPLIEVANWAHCSTFSSGKAACTWSNIDNPVYHYTILSTNDKEWQCGTCTLLNKVGSDECETCGTKVKTKRLGLKTSLR